MLKPIALYLAGVGCLIAAITIGFGNVIVAVRNDPAKDRLPAVSKMEQNQTEGANERIARAPAATRQVQPPPVVPQAAVAVSPPGQPLAAAHRQKPAIRDVPQSIERRTLRDASNAASAVGTNESARVKSTRKPSAHRNTREMIAGAVRPQAADGATVERTYRPGPYAFSATN